METTASLSNVHLHISNVTPSVSSTLLLDKKGPLTPRETGQEEWENAQVADRMFWMKGFKVNKKGGLIFLDQETLKKQQGVFKEVMMQVGSQLLSGKLAVRISLPIRIFEPRTLLERVADGWNYAPTLLHKAACQSDPIERMKYVISFVAAGFHLCVGQLKPFNPILGETYQAQYPDGTQIFMEHVSHHPVKSSFHVVGPSSTYQLMGTYEFESVTSRNSIINHQVGTAKIVFSDGQTITYTVPQIKMSGILLGERVVELAGIAKFADTANQLVAEVNFDANNSFLMKSNADDIKGFIGHAKKSPKHPICTMQGSWLTHLNFDGKAYWRVESEPVYQHIPDPNPLPSDCRFREDLVALQAGNTTVAQAEKLRLEEIQRNDRKLRDSHKETRGRKGKK